jgi:GAF domain-containing protein
MPHGQPTDPTDDLAQTRKFHPSEINLQGVFQRVVDLAKLTLPEVAEASVTVLQGKNAHTAACTGNLALALDESQYQHGHGPCMLAATAITIESVTDMAAESRWPDWTAGALKAGAHSSLSIALPIQGGVSGALNLYATTPHAFDDDDIAVAQSLASYASFAMADAHLNDAQITLAQHIAAATGGEAIIEQAKGITMAERQCTAEEALAILTTTAHDTNRTVHDVAQALVEEATGPRTQ